MALALFIALAAQEPDLVKVRSYIESRKSEDPGRYKAAMKAVSRARINRLYKKKWYSELKAESRAITKRGWIPQFDLSRPTVHAIGRLSSADKSPIQVTAIKIIDANHAVCEIRHRALGKRGVTLNKAKHYYLFITDTSKMLTDRVVKLNGVWYVRGIAKKLQLADGDKPVDAFELQQFDESSLNDD